MTRIAAHAGLVNAYPLASMVVKTVRANVRFLKNVRRRLLNVTSKGQNHARSARDPASLHTAGLA